jgi:hypothetical protein
MSWIFWRAAELSDVTAFHDLTGWKTGRLEGSMDEHDAHCTVAFAAAFPY